MSTSIESPPPDFVAKMAGLLGDEFAQFKQSCNEAPAVGLRVNTLKLNANDFSILSPFALKAMGPHEPAGFLVTDGRLQVKGDLPLATHSVLQCEKTAVHLTLF